MHGVEWGTDLSGIRSPDMKRHPAAAGLLIVSLAAPGAATRAGR